MKNRYFNKSISIFLSLLLIIGLFPPIAFAQPGSSTTFTEVKGFNKAVFDSHFSRADRELSVERWLAEARLGLTQAICAWELTADTLYDNPLIFEEARNQLEKWGAEELEKRFSQWLLGRFFGEAAERAMLNISQAFGETQKTYSWNLDNEGNIIFDEITGDPLIIRPNEEDREFAHDLLLWRSEAQQHVKNAITNLNPELLAYIPLELRETMNELIYNTAANKSSDVKIEFEIIAAREERIFTSRRTRDIWSLRSKSEAEAARIFTERLIAATEEACKIGIEELNARIEQAAAGTGDLAIMGEEWLRLYKEQFDRGLRAWEEAEERFFIRRIEWEQDSFRLFSEGEEVWLAAFNQLEEERQRWELSAKELFQAGENLFKNISDDFERNIAEARREFELNMAMRIGEGTTRVKALIDMYLISASAAISAKENIKFWESHNNEKETQKAREMHSLYMGNALDARDRILLDYAELLGTGVLKDILSPNASSEDFHLDEYQIALVRAKALVLYWERKTAISQAVAAYANDLSAGRMTDAEGLRAWEEAKAAYNESLIIYETELIRLNETGEDIKNQQEVLHNLVLVMQREEQKLTRLNSEYTTLVSISEVSLEDQISKELNEKLDALLLNYLFLQDSDNRTFFMDAFLYGMAWGIAEHREAIEEFKEMMDDSEFLEELTDEQREGLSNNYNEIIAYTMEDFYKNAKEFIKSFFEEYELSHEVHFSQDIQDLFFKRADIELNSFDFLAEFEKYHMIYSDVLFIADEDSYYYFGLFFDQVINIAVFLDSLNNLNYQIDETLKNLENSLLTTDEKKELLSAKEAELAAQQEVYNTLKNEYFLETDKFMSIGALYDRQYSALKGAYENTDLKRFEYEKQDAIQRWASTSYLNTNNIDLENNKTKLAKAQLVLEVLSDLYDNESKRSYDNPEYNALYAAYEESFGRKLKILGTVETVFYEINNEFAENERLRHEYQLLQYQLGYFYLHDKSEINNYITVDDSGRLVFIKDENMTLSEKETYDESALLNYFYTASINEGSRHATSVYEDSITALSQRMTGYLTNDNKIKDWSLARDYLLLSLIKANEDFDFLNDYYSGLGLLSSNDNSLSGLTVCTGVSLFVAKQRNLYSILFNENNKNPDLYNGIAGLDLNAIFYYEEMYQEAWNRLSDEEKADLEFYIILTLSGNDSEFAGFSKAHTLDTYKTARDYVSDRYSVGRKRADSFFYLAERTQYKEMRNINRIALDRVDSVYTETKNQYDTWLGTLKQTLLSLEETARAYNKSCEKIAVYEKLGNGNKSIDWDDMSLVLKTTEKFSEDDIAELEIYWETMQRNINMEFENIPDALITFLEWSRYEENFTKHSLETHWQNAQQTQRQNDYTFQSATEAYIAGRINIDELKAIAESAYGPNAAAAKNHLNNMHTALLNNLSMYLDTEFNFYNEFSAVGNDLINLTVQILENRYMSELTTREAEWHQMKKDILEKFYEWQESAAIILENGRTDWIQGMEKMQEAYRTWNINFQNEYERVNTEWAEAYLAGLEDKETWLKLAADAANQASSESFLSLVGAEAERMSRFMDTREPFGIRNAVPQAQTLMAELLQSSGIVNMSNAFSSISSITGTTATQTRRGLGGISIWNASLDKSAATDLARKTNAEISDAESRKLAYTARLSADEAIKGLEKNVDSANQSFREKIDNIFIFSGLWSRSGDNYVKEIVKGSTVFTPVISQTVTVTGYSNYELEPIVLTTNIDESYLATLNTMAIRTLIDKVYEEVYEATKGIFGIGEDSIVIDDDREQSPGKFGAHIGYGPNTKDDMGEKRDDMFYDEGAGELGRLMADYTYWAVIDARGYAELALAPWERRMWDDSDSWFKAPNIRTIGTIACSIVAGFFTAGAGFAGIALAVGISTASDVAFGTLDLVHGYKSLGEVSLDIGKAVLVNTASSAIGAGAGALSKGLTTTTSVGLNSVINGTTIAAGNYLSTVATSYINAFDFHTGKFDSNAAHSSWYSVNSVAGAVGAGVSSGLGNYFGATVSTPQQKYLGGAINLATAGGGELAKYGVYTAYNLGAGMSLENSFKKAYNDMGGLTFNVANLGSMLDFAVSTFARNNPTGQLASTDAGIAKMMYLSNKLSNAGILEINIGSNGITGQFGTGGINLGGAIYDLAKRGIDYTQMQMMSDPKARETALTTYGWGDWTAENTSMRIASGLDTLVFDEKLDGYGHTVQNSTGNGRTITIKDNGDVNMNAIRLQHEAYRDGIVTADNYLETRTATLAHTEMALRMMNEGLKINDKNITNDINAYSQGRDFFNAYVDENYDSSSDYWKLMRDGTLVNDNSGWLTDELGRPILNANGQQIGANGIETGLLNILFGGTHGVAYDNYNDDQKIYAQMLMRNAGMSYTVGVNGGSWNNNVTGQSLNMQHVMQRVGDVVAAPVFARYYEDNAIEYLAWLRGNNIGDISTNIIPHNAMSRYYEAFIPSIVDNYLDSTRHFFNASDGFYVSGVHGTVYKGINYPNYEDNKHFGTDFSNGKSGGSIHLGIPGIVRYTASETGPVPDNGNWMVVEYGYRFEGIFMGSGIYGEYAHMENEPNFRINTFLDSNRVIGTVGNTGYSTAAHLHYTMYTLENYTYSQASLRYLLNNNIENTVSSTNARAFIGTHNGIIARKITYNIENFLGRL